MLNLFKVMADKGLKMTFDPATIEHLGVRMYSTLPPVLAELVANSFDADASKVSITLNDADDKKEIIVEDDGLGMSLQDINNKFLRIGRNRRDEEDDEETPKGRSVIGKKGIGKLSFFGIAEEIEVVTRKDSKENSFLLRWQDIKESKTSEYHPKLIKIDEACSEASGTKIILRGLRRQTDFDPESLAVALSKIFIIDNSFQVLISHNNNEPSLVENEKKYNDLEKQIERDIPSDVLFESDYESKDNIVGHLIATETPISVKTNMKGITIFSRKKLVNAPEYFSESISSHFFSYLTGWLEIDFIDDLDEDVISTDRQSLNWEHPEMAKLREYLKKMMNWLEHDWRSKRESIRRSKMDNSTGINTADWFSKLPQGIRQNVEGVVKGLIKDSESATEVTANTVMRMHELVPEFPLYHWRHLHPEVQRVSKIYYENQDYYTAFLEAAKRYADAVRSKSGVAQHLDRPVMENAFKFDPPGPILSVTEGYKKIDGTDFKETTLNNIREAHKMFSVGIICGGRNVIDHEEIIELKTAGLFTENDCLDALSLLSHLFWRLDHSTKVR